MAPIKDGPIQLFYGFYLGDRHEDISSYYTYQALYMTFLVGTLSVAEVSFKHKVTSKDSKVLLFISPVASIELPYQGKKEIKVDVIVYRERSFKEPWFLLVPAGKEDILSTEKVVELYRRRMNIEVTFRDFKSHLGVRGLSLKVRKGERLDRLLGAMVLTYILLLTLGASEIGKFLRKRIEIPRSKARHGTRKTLSVLTISLFAISDTFLFARDNLINILTECFNQLEREKVFMLPSF